eukprot:jgi/Ulvmu1/2597/UM014_0048.1
MHSLLRSMNCRQRTAQPSKQFEHGISVLPHVAPRMIMLENVLCHCRREQAYDLETGQWSLVEDRAYFDPVWEFGGRISGHCPAGRRATRIPDEEVEQQCMHAAMVFVGAAIADGALLPQLRAFVQSFDTVTCAADGAEDGEVQAVAKIAEEPHFHDTFCGFLLDSLRQDSPVSQAGIAVFEQIKTTINLRAAALFEAAKKSVEPTKYIRITSKTVPRMSQISLRDR